MRTDVATSRSPPSAPDYFNPATGVNVIADSAGNYCERLAVGCRADGELVSFGSNSMNVVKKAALIELSNDEALVLFDWLARVDGSLPVADPSEQDVLWRLEGQLEKNLVEPLAADYEGAVNLARSRIRGKQ